MKAIEFDRYGSPEVLQIVEREIPEPAPGEIRIRIHATAVNSGDWRVRGASPFLVRLFFGLFRPKKSARVLGSVLSGTVDKAGEGVQGFSVGDRVFGMSDLAMGCYAQFICLPESAPIVKGTEIISHEEAASIPFGLHTAHHFLKKVDLQPGMKVLVIGASGAVGSAAVQLARNAKCHVTAVTSGKNADLVKSLGANEVLNYETESLAEVLQKYDVILETVGRTDVKTLRTLLKQGGDLVLISAGMKDMFLAGIRSAFWKLKIHTGVAAVSRQDMEYFRKIIESGDYSPVLEKTYNMGEVVQAHEHAEKGHKRGNLALRMMEA